MHLKLSERFFIISFSIVSIVFVGILFVRDQYNWNGSFDQVEIEEKYLEKVKQLKSMDKKIKIILMWTKYLKNLVSKYNNMLNECPIDNCFFTSQKTLLNHSNAIVFHINDIHLNDFPGIRFPNQKWIFYSMEPPIESNFNGFNFISHMFNLTWTYRRDSDIVSSHGNVIPIGDRKQLKAQNVFNVWRNKKRMAYWVVNNCNTQSGRESYIDELKKYIEIDVNGRCGGGKCSYDKHNNDNNCFHPLEDYLFAIVFENHLCKDYFTEKLFNTLERNVIPIVMSNANLTHIMSHHSVINAFYFRSPKDLADYLLDVGTDFIKYKSFFAWKKHFKVSYQHNDICKLCEKLQSTDKKSYSDIKSWWIDKSHCKKWKEVINKTN